MTDRNPNPDPDPNLRPEDLTHLLNEAADGSESAAREILPHVIAELRKLAKARMAQLPTGDSMQVTALVTEAYLHLADRDTVAWKSRAEFFFVAARAMKDILIEQARARRAKKRGGDLVRVEFEELQEIHVALPSKTHDLIALDRALDRLEAENPEGHRIVMLRYFAGLSVPEVAKALDTSPSTIERRWRFLRAWLAEELEPGTN